MVPDRKLPDWRTLDTKSARVDEIPKREATGCPRYVNEDGFSDANPLFPLFDMAPGQSAVSPEQTVVRLKTSNSNHSHRASPDADNLIRAAVKELVARLKSHGGKSRDTANTTGRMQEVDNQSIQPSWRSELYRGTSRQRFRSIG